MYVHEHVNIRLCVSVYMFACISSGAQVPWEGWRSEVKLIFFSLISTLFVMQFVTVHCSISRLAAPQLPGFLNQTFTHHMSTGVTDECYPVTSGFCVRSGILDSGPYIYMTNSSSTESIVICQLSICQLSSNSKITTSCHLVGL